MIDVIVRKKERTTHCSAALVYICLCVTCVAQIIIGTYAEEGVEI